MHRSGHHSVCDDGRLGADADNDAANGKQPTQCARRKQEPRSATETKGNMTSGSTGMSGDGMSNGTMSKDGMSKDHMKKDGMSK